MTIRDQEQEGLVQVERRNSMRDSGVVGIPLITPSRDRPVITESVSDPERRILFDNDDEETYDNRAERSQMVDRPFREETRETHSEEPRIVSPRATVRSTSSIGISMSDSEPTRIPVTSILGYGGGTAIPQQPRTIRLGTGHCPPENSFWRRWWR